MSSAYSINFERSEKTEFAEKLRQVYFLQKVQIASRKLQREQTRPREYFQNYFCENNPSGYDFQLFSPHRGCAKMVCRFCAQESPEKLLRPSVHSFKGRSFAFANKTKKSKNSKNKTSKSKTSKNKTKKTEKTEKTESEQEWEQ